MCQLNNIENETHVLFSCTLYNALRSKLYDEIVHKYNFFQDPDITSKILFLLNNIDHFVCRSFAAFVYDVMSYSIVNRCRLVMKLDKFLCFMFLFAFLALIQHKTQQKHAFFGRITNQKYRLIYSKLTCEPKTKDCAGSRSVQHLIATVLFLLLKFPWFHNHSLD